MVIRFPSTVSFGLIMVVASGLKKVTSIRFAKVMSLAFEKVMPLGWEKVMPGPNLKEVRLCLTVQWDHFTVQLVREFLTFACPKRWKPDRATFLPK